MLDIDFKIILVQVITFLIAVFVLWKIAWKSLVDVLSKRKSDIAKSISDAESLKLQTDKLKVEYEQMVADIDKKAQEFLQKATLSGEENKQKIITEAREEAKKILEIAKKQIEQERDLVKDDLRREIVPIAISIAEKIMEKTIDKGTQKQLIDKFLNDISAYSEQR
ncbi:MAG: F0F1 ATP synthase subunit B [Elusimicrobia bacterium]|nr:F0F1 ATP synthase subunit B [Elusimicrobiota bacterium]